MKKPLINNGEFSKHAFLAEGALLGALATPLAFHSLHPISKALALLPLAKGTYDAVTKDTEEEDGTFRGERLTAGAAGSGGLIWGLAGKAALGGMGGGPYIRTKLRGT